MKHPLLCCLALSHVDYDAASLWLRWAAFLSSKSSHDEKYRLVIVATRRAYIRAQSEFPKILDGARDFFRWTLVQPDDEDETGYPQSSSHLFLRSIEACNRLHTGFAVLFIEPDAVPVKPGWFQIICEAYAKSRMPFMGLHIPSTKDAVDRYGFPAFHQSGVSIYPPNALKLAPSIRQCMESIPEKSPWAPRLPAWDLFCAHEIVPESEQTDRIQQIWRSDPWTPDNLNRLSSRAALFHQSKDGSLIASLAMRSYPDFLDQLPPPSRCYQLDTGATSMVVGGREIKFTPTRFRLCGGRALHVLAPKLAIDDALLSGIAGTRGLTIISREDYAKLAPLSS